MLCNFLGVAGLAGIFIMLFSMPLNTQLSQKMDLLANSFIH